MSLILKENEYLRKCNESVIRNNITIPDNTSCHINDKIYIDEKKKRRRATSVSLEYNSEGEIKTSYELDQHSYIANNNIVNNSIIQIKLEEESLYSNRRSSKKYFTLQSLINTSNSEIEVKDSQEIIKNSSNEETNYYRNKLDSSQTNVKPRNQYLFFKTPKENEKKKIDYTYFDELNKVVNEAEKPNI